MTRFENERFGYFEDRSTGNVYADIEFVGCHFTRVGFSTVTPARWREIDLVSRRSTARNLRFINCEVQSISFLGPGLVEDCVVDGLTVRQHLQTKGTAFSRTVIRGQVDKLMITQTVDLSGEYPEVQRQFDVANTEFYKNVDWALDISAGLFKDCDIRGIPARLIRRDCESQFVISREEAMRGRWREVDLRGTHWGSAIEMLLRRGYPDSLLVAPKRSRNYRALLDGLLRLRDADIVN